MTAHPSSPGPPPAHPSVSSPTLPKPRAVRLEEPDRPASVDVQPDRPAPVDVQPDRRGSVDVQPDRRGSVDVQPDRPARVNVQPDRPAHVDTQEPRARVEVQPDRPARVAARPPPRRRRLTCPARAGEGHGGGRAARRCLWALLLLCACLALPGGAIAHLPSQGLLAQASPTSGERARGPILAARAAPTVVLFAASGSRLAGQLRRELEASGFVVLDPPPWHPPSPAVADAVSIDADERRVRVLHRPAGSTAPAFLVRAQWAIAPGDPLATRRVGLAIVEHLRSGGAGARPAAEATRRVPGGDQPFAAAAGGPATGATAVTANPAPAATAATAGGPGAGAAAATAGSPGAGATAVAASSDLAGAPPRGPSTTLVTPRPPPQPAPRAWSLGAATAFNLGGGPEPTGHVQITGETALAGPALVSLRLLWPLLGADLDLPDSHVRLWTTGAVVGLRVPLRAAPADLVPYLAATTGLRLVLTDTNFQDPRDSRVALVPALCAGLFLGLRYPVARLVHLSLEVGSEWSRGLGAADHPAHTQQALDARVTRAALGVSFAY